jgi:hypothetical protein
MTANGLLGIFKEGLWASSAYHLNDSGEFELALRLVKERVQAALDAGTNSCEEELEWILDYVVSHLKKTFEVFVTSFCEVPDLLSQWQAYGKGVNGYAIGFRYEDLEPALSSGFKFVRCRYTEQEQMTIVDDVISVLVDHHRRNFENDNQVSAEIVSALASIKHSGFSSEKEWRLVTTWSRPLADIERRPFPGFFREGRGGIIPYMIAKLQQGPNQSFRPSSITIGPNSDSEAARLALQTFLISKGLSAIEWQDRIKINVSDTPFRL